MGESLTYWIPTAMWRPSIRARTRRGPSALLVREEFVRELMDQHGVGIVWTVVCLKSVKLADPAPGYPLLRISGAYRLSETGPVGFMRPRVMRREKLPWES